MRLPPLVPLRRLAIGAMACMTLSVASAADCGAQLPAASRQIAHVPGYVVAFAPSAWPLPVGQHFSVHLEVCPAPGKAMPLRVQLDADMPLHKHGMNYQTTVQSTGPGRYTAQGLMFHMPGRWRLMFDLNTGTTTVRVPSELDVQ